MSTSRSATPADPTLRATTEDSSRGGLFVRSNVVNPVQGVDVSGTTIGNGTITLQLNGQPVGTFTTNQSDNETFNFVVDTSNPGSGGGDGTNNYVTGGDFGVTTPNVLTLLREGLDPLTFNLSALAVTRTNQEIDDRADARITAADIQDLNNVQDTFGSRDQILRVNTAGDELIFTDLPPATLTTDLIESADNTIVDANGSVTGRLDLSARPALVGNSGEGDNVGATPQNARRIILAQDTGLVLDRNAATGDITIRMAHADAQRAAASAPQPSSALDAPPVEDRTITYRPAANSGDRITDVTGITVTRTYTPPGGSETTTTITTATDTITDSGQTATIVIPETDATPPGDYRVRATVETTSQNNVVMQNPEDNTINRVIPHYVSRSDLTSQADLEAPSTTEIDSTFSATTGVSTIAGTGFIYIAADRRLLPDNTLFASGTAGLSPQLTRVRMITVTLADSSTVEFNVFRARIGGVVQLTNFRSSYF